MTFDKESNGCRTAVESKSKVVNSALRAYTEARNQYRIDVFFRICCRRWIAGAQFRQRAGSVVVPGVPVRAGYRYIEEMDIVQ